MLEYVEELNGYYEVERIITWVYNDPQEIIDITSNTIREFIKRFKSSERKGKPCTQKQLNYLKHILARTYDFDLSEEQYNFLKKCTISEMSEMINLFKKYDTFQILDKKKYEEFVERERLEKEKKQIKL